MRRREDRNMSIAGIVIIVLALLLIVALVVLYKTRSRLKEMEGFQTIKQPGTDDDDGVIGSFGD